MECCSLTQNPEQIRGRKDDSDREKKRRDDFSHAHFHLLPWDDSRNLLRRLGRYNDRKGPMFVFKVKFNTSNSEF